MNSKNTKIICVKLGTYNTLKERGSITDSFDSVIQDLLLEASEK
jgi:hypothetical protein